MSHVHDTAEKTAVHVTRSELRQAAGSWLKGEDAAALAHVIAALDTYIESIGIDERFWRVLRSSASVLEEHGHHNAAVALREYFQAVAEQVRAPIPRDAVWDRLLGLDGAAEWSHELAAPPAESRLLLSVSG